MNKVLKGLNMFIFLNLMIILGLGEISATMEPKGSCFKRFEYEYGVLQKLIQLEEKLSKQDQTITSLTQARKDFEEALMKLQNRQPMETKSSSSSYVRWGRTVCPNGAHIVYHGYAAGGDHANSGSGANRLCLPRDPLWGNYTSGTQTATRIYGGEYQVNSYDSWRYLHDEDVPCAVCRIQRSNVLMIPGRNECYNNYTLEYSGYLMSGYHGHPSPSDYICMDGNPEVLEGGNANKDGALFYFVEGVCGSLKCPPYVDGRELTCAVCSSSP